MSDISVLEANPISDPEKKSLPKLLPKRDHRGRWIPGETGKSNPTLWASIWDKIAETASETDVPKRQEKSKKIKSAPAPDDERTMPRRKFLKLGAAGLASLFLAAYGEGWINLPSKLTEEPTKTIPPPIPPINKESPQTSTPPKIEAEKIVTPQDYLNEILSLPLKSPERTQKESEYVLRIRQSPNLEPSAKLRLIDCGFWVISEINQRAYLLDLRYQIRSKENSTLIKLNKEQLNWTQEKKIHPEVLGLCLDAESKARGIIAQILSLTGGGVEKFRPDLVRLKEFNNPKAVDLGSVTISDMMINAGGMARLVCYETGLMLNRANTNSLDFNNFIYGFSFIGGKQAVTEINPKAFPTSIPALEQLCTLLRENTGLNFVPENIPGSEWVEKHKNISGGAIGLQFMPSKALEIYHLLEKVGYKFNPFDPESALVGAWVFLAMGELVGNDEVRFGYLKGHEDKIKGAIAKWNPLADQIDKIYDAAVDYYNKIIEPPLMQAAKH